MGELKNVKNGLKEPGNEIKIYFEETEKIIGLVVDENALPFK